MTICWSGATVKCGDCGSEDVEYVRDEEHDGGDCEVFRCNSCNRTLHIELPD